MQGKVYAVVATLTDKIISLCIGDDWDIVDIIIDDYLDEE